MSAGGIKIFHMMSKDDTELSKIYSHYSVVTELQLKLRELCGASMFMRCQLPTEDLDSLVSITSDEDLTNLIEEYDRTCYSSQLPLPPLKIRALLSLPKLNKQDVSPSRASTSSNSSSSMAPRFLMPVIGPARCLHQQIPKMGISRKTPGQWKVPLPYYPNSGSYYSGEHHSNNVHLIHSGGRLQ